MNQRKAGIHTGTEAFRRGINERRGQTMLQGFFNYDNPVWRFIGKLGDLVLLNLLWLVCCIPVFTAGAATTAVYYVTLKLVRDEDDSTIKSFFRSFIQNFKQATAIWLLILLAGSLVAFDLWFIMGGAAAGISGTLKTILTAVFGGMTLILLFITTYVFPLQARFYNTVKRTLFNALFMSVRHMGQTIMMLVVDGFLVAAVYFALFVMPQAAMLLLLFGFPLIAFVNSYIFTPIFKKYIPEEDKQGHESGLSPLLDENNKEIEDAIQSLKGK